MVVNVYAIILAAGVNVLFFLALYIYPSARKTGNEPKVLDVHAITASIWNTVEIAQRAAREEKPSTTSRKGALQLPEMSLSLDFAGTDTSIHASPDRTIDWHAEAGKQVAKFGESEAESPLNSKPKILQLPEVANDPNPGDSVRFEGGVQLTWISKNCYILSDPLRIYAGSGKHCKPSERDRRSAEFAARLEEVAKPSYLRKPVLPPNDDAKRN